MQALGEVGGWVGGWLGGEIEEGERWVVKKTDLGENEARQHPQGG